MVLTAAATQAIPPLLALFLTCHLPRPEPEPVLLNVPSLLVTCLVVEAKGCELQPIHWLSAVKQNTRATQVSVNGQAMQASMFLEVFHKVAPQPAMGLRRGHHAT